MNLSGIHHVTAITADRERSARFYADVLGLDPRSGPLDLTAIPDAPRGRAGPGSVHRIVWRVSDVDALSFWLERLSGHTRRVGFEPRAGGPVLRFADPDGLEHEVIADRARDRRPLASDARAIPPPHALQGLVGVRAYCRAPGASADLLAGRLGFAATGPGVFRTGSRGSRYWLDPAPAERAIQGAGSVHHVAWSCEPGDQAAWRQRAIGMGARVTPVLERGRTRSFYFREPSGVLFEIAARGAGIAAPRASVTASATPPTVELRLPVAA